MRHKRLSQKEIDNIRDQLLKPLKSKIEELKKQVAAKAIKFIDDNTPPELLPLIKEGNPFLKTTNVIYFHDLRYEDRYIIIDEPVSNNWEIEDNARLACKELTDQIESIYKELDKTGNRIVCALNEIRTTRKLEQEWPEAYQAYINHLEENESSESTTTTGCDQVESLRAELSQLKPVEND